MAGMSKDKRTGKWLLSFSYAGQKFLVSSKTDNEPSAKRFKAQIEQTIQLLDRGNIAMPVDADIRTFITTGGIMAAKPRLAAITQFAEICDRYLADQQDKHTNTVYGEKIHIGHFKRHLGDSTKLNSITTETLQKYVASRRKKIYRGEPISGKTIKKELVTFTQIWAWAKTRKYIQRECPIYNENHKWAIKIPKSKEKEKFQTWRQIEKRIERGNLNETEQAKLWESLFLEDSEIVSLLAYVKEKARHPFIYPMFVFAAYTGARRGEVCRSRVEDFDFDNRIVKLRERKRDRSKSETVRIVDMHQKVTEVMREYFKQHPGGPYTIAVPLKMAKRKPKLDFEEMRAREADYHFKEPLKSGKWKVLYGWHVLRHSFGANLARAGVPRDQIGQWMGHSTEEMKTHYQHLFPQDGPSRIGVLVA